MTSALPQLDVSEYSVGWIAALPHERVAARAMLDKDHGPPLDEQKENPSDYKHSNDKNNYNVGSISGPNGEHNIVIASLPYGRTGKAPAATVAMRMLSTFPAIKFGLMVGIGGGIPADDIDIRLGDVVVSKPADNFGGVRQYDVGKVTPNGFVERGHLAPPPEVLLNALLALDAEYRFKGNTIPDNLKAMRKPAEPGYEYQGKVHDRLFYGGFVHPEGHSDCSRCPKDQEEERDERRDPENPRVHYGTIASGDDVIADAAQRDHLVKKCLCYEMEAASLINSYPCLVIRGICDYSDSHKNDRWQNYAAITAAAYAKDLLRVTDVAEIQGTRYAREVVREIQELKSTTKEIARSLKHKDLDESLSKLDPSALHLKNKKRRVENTGKWLLEDDKFIQWSSDAAEHRTLLCYGAAGAGKTILCSLVVDTLEERVATDSSIGLAYMYFDYRNQKEQTAESVIGSVLKQLLMRLSKIPETISNMFGKLITGGQLTSSEDAVGLLDAVCGQFIRVYVCLDALDEAKNVQGLLESLRDASQSMQILMTGRHHIQGLVQKCFEEDNGISIEAHEKDIQLFIEHEIGGPHDLEPDAMDDELRENIRKELVGSAKGVFLLPALQLRSVLQAVTRRDREEALETLPSNLDEAFDKSMSMVMQQPAALFKRAATIIAWMHLSEWILNIEDLLYVLAIRRGDTFFDRRGIPPNKKTLLNCCHGLVLTDQSTEVRLVHYALDEHLNRQDRIFDLTKAEWHSEIARTCLTALNFPPEAITPTEVDVWRSKLILLSWAYHLRMADDVRDAPMELAQTYLESDLTNDFEFFWSYRRGTGWNSEARLTPLHLAAYFGIPKLVDHYILTGLDPNLLDGDGETPLSRAAGQRHEAVVNLLLANSKVDVNLKGVNGQGPLLSAIQCGDMDFVRLLLGTKNIDIRTKDEHGDTALHYAVQKEKAMVELLLENDMVEINPRNYFGFTPLRYAAKEDEEIVKLLLKTGNAHVNSAQSSGETILHYVTQRGDEAIMALLLGTDNIDVNAKDRDDRTPLHYAVEQRNERAARLLLGTNKVDVNLKDRDGRTALSYAEDYKFKNIVKLIEDYVSTMGSNTDTTGHLRKERGDCGASA